MYRSKLVLLGLVLVALTGCTLTLTTDKPTVQPVAQEVTEAPVKISAEEEKADDMIVYNYPEYGFSFSAPSVILPQPYYVDKYPEDNSFSVRSFRVENINKAERNFGMRGFNVSLMESLPDYYFGGQTPHIDVGVSPIEEFTNQHGVKISWLEHADEGWVGVHAWVEVRNKKVLFRFFDHVADESGVIVSDHTDAILDSIELK